MFLSGRFFRDAQRRRGCSRRNAWTFCRIPTCHARNVGRTGRSPSRPSGSHYFPTLFCRACQSFYAHDRGLGKIWHHQTGSSAGPETRLRFSRLGCRPPDCQRHREGWWPMIPTFLPCLRCRRNTATRIVIESPRRISLRCQHCGGGFKRGLLGRDDRARVLRARRKVGAM